MDYDAKDRGLLWGMNALIYYVALRDRELSDASVIKIIQEYIDELYRAGKPEMLTDSNYGLKEIFKVAISHARFECANYLYGIDNIIKEDMDTRDIRYRTGFITVMEDVVKRGSYAEVKYLLDIGIDPNGKSSTLSILFVSLLWVGKKSDDIPILHMLLDRRPYNLNAPIKNVDYLVDQNHGIPKEKLGEYSPADILAQSIQPGVHMPHCFEILVHLVFRCGYDIETKRMHYANKQAIDAIQAKMRDIPTDVQRIIATFIL